MALQKTVLACGIALASFSAMAYDLPSVNMGGSSFYDGAPAPNGPGWYFLEYLQSIRADTLKGNDGKNLPVANPKTDVFVPLSQIIYLSDTKWGNMTQAGPLYFLGLRKPIQGLHHKQALVI